MNLFGAFLRLIRWPNLVFIGLAQFLFYYCIQLPSFHHADNGAMTNVLTLKYFWLLSFSSVLIASAGYIINDYFDLNIDTINKPERIIVEKLIKRRWTILWHWILSGLGILLGFYISWRIRNPIIGFSNLICVTMLWFYSTTFKRKLLIGNVIVSLLTAWVILVLYACEFRLHRLVDPAYQHSLGRVYKFAVLYAAFAFIISLVREVVKDMEDMTGDESLGCRTMPIVWGIPASKVFAGTWLVVLMGALIVIQFYVLQYRWWISIAYTWVAIIIPIVWLLIRLRKAVTRGDYHHLSQLIKMLMLTGMMSMIFFKWYTSWIA
ncbi:MAG: geranylgeranylglycerol-phosphate geranylgeranyltransferase [Chitinophagales bacterium]